MHSNDYQNRMLGGQGEGPAKELGTRQNCEAQHVGPANVVGGEDVTRDQPRSYSFEAVAGEAVSAPPRGQPPLASLLFSLDDALRAFLERLDCMLWGTRRPRPKR